MATQTDASEENSRVALQEHLHFTSEPTTIVPGLSMVGYTICVPLDYGDPGGPSIQVFFRVVNDVGRVHEKLSYLLYLQGGPGSEAPRPTESSGWLSKASQYFSVVMLDQRGTGRSSPISVQSLQRMGDPRTQADYLQHFRADNICRDAELVRTVLLGASQRWSILGQSFGGFCCVRYLSSAPKSLSEVFMTGGIPPGIDQPCSAHETYTCLFKKVMNQNQKYYSRFPADVHLVQKLVLYLDSLPGEGAALPRGGILKARGLQLLGLVGLGSAGGFERLHFLLESAFDGPHLTTNFLINFEGWMSWSTNPLYAILHESIYCQGQKSGWAAHAVRETTYREAFDAVLKAKQGQPVLFTGEMVFPWMFDDFVELQPVKEAAQILAEKSDWPHLYDLDVLQKNKAPIAAACYYDDMYVDFQLAEKTASRIGTIRQWVTNEYMHSGIREDGARIFDRLLGMTRNSRPVF